MKPNPKKIIVILLLLCIAPLSFAEQYYSLGAGLNFYKDRFPEDDYARQHVVTSGLMSFYFFPKDFFLGAFAKISMGGSSITKEENERESMKPRSNSIFDLRFVAAPSFRVKLGSKLFIPLSIGPSLVFTSEKTTEKLIKGSYGIANNTDKDYEYQSISFGFDADIGLVFVPGKSFMLKPGVFFDYIFARSENGQMRMNYRATDNKSFTAVPYSAFNVGFYLTLGMRI